MGRGATRKRQDDVNQLALFDSVSNGTEQAVPTLTAAWIPASAPSTTSSQPSTNHSQPSPNIVPFPPPEPERNANGYRISDADPLGKGSPKIKFQKNVAAIELLKAIEDEARWASEEEKKILVQYTGWGGLPQVFDPKNGKWREERETLDALLTSGELESARASTLNAHYTSPEVIRAIYAALDRLGFEGGRVLEPACGIGHFLGLMPEAMLRQSEIAGVEIDDLSARIAWKLYPDADLRRQPFEEARLLDNTFDLAVSNIPFGNYRPFDPRLNKMKFLIHDWFFAAALEKVRPGGLVAFITSKGTMDKADSTLREYVSAKADFLGAIRLPETAFKQIANTEVTTDIVFLRKRLPGERPFGHSWKELDSITNSLNETMAVNEYYLARPEMMLGEMRLSGRMYTRGEPALVASEGKLEDGLNKAIQHLPEKLYQAERSKVDGFQVEGTEVPAPEEVKPDSYVLCNGRLSRREGDVLRPLKGLSPLRARRLRGLVQLRDAVRRCLATQMDGSDEEAILSAREQLNLSYDAFVARCGPVSRPANVSAFKGDPDLPLLLSLENYDAETLKATKAAIFHERTIRPPPVVEVTSPADALLVTLNEKGGVDLDHLCGLLGRPKEEVLEELKGAVFLNPQSCQWETADEYLSGNVREKLKAAEAAVIDGFEYQINVAALREAQPVDLKASEIDARLGSAWLPVGDVQSFARQLLKEAGITISHTSQLGLWTVQGDAMARRSVSGTAEWGTERRSALRLIEDALNLRTPTVYDKDPETDRDVVNVLETEAAREKQAKIRERFSEWIWKDDERRERLVTLYNETFNGIRLREFNGDHLTLPGASSAVCLRPHQKAAVWRILQTGNCLLAHVVGAGKTYTMVAAAMELRRLGLANKPMFAVPNHMLEQFSRELLTLYPAANILVATKADFEKKRRKVLMGRIATGNWDAVIVTHSGFEKIPVSRETQEALFAEQLEELTVAIIEHREHEDSRMVKTLERAKKRLEAKLKTLSATEKKDDCLTFEELGVDRLFIDEAHAFKNLFYVTKMTRIAGLPQTASQRALDMFLKVGFVQRQNNGGGVVFATGTPVTNSVAEMYTMQRYLQPEVLRSLEVSHFDAWAATFGEPVTAMELSPDGAGYRLHTRFARFINVPELMQHFRRAADIQTQSMLQLPIPKLKGGKPETVSAPRSEELKEIVDHLVERAEALRSGRVDPREDNMLLVTGDGRKAALDLRLHDPSLPDHPDSKVNLATEKIFRLWQEHPDTAQLVFCDLSTPTGGKGFSVYEDMREKLCKLGIPLEQIAFMQDFESDSAKASLFADVRSAKVRVLFGSTQKMGSGTNVQERLIALHHLDAPWRPSDVEQREGRILRQGNTNAEVMVFRYVTESSFDAYMWQTLETKAKFIDQVMTGESDLRRIEDVDGTALTYAEVKAIASGNPLVVEKAGIDAEIGRLSRLKTQYHESRFSLRKRLRQYGEQRDRDNQRLEAVKKDIPPREDITGDHFVMEVEKETLRNRGIAGERINRLARRLRGSQTEHRIGRMAGFDLWIADSLLSGPELVLRGSTTYRAKVSDSALGTIKSLEATLSGMEQDVTRLERRMAEANQKIEELAIQNDQPFEHAEKLEALLKRQLEIAEGLDLNRDQASARMETEAVPEDEPEEADMSLREMGFAEYHCN